MTNRLQVLDKGLQPLVCAQLTSFTRAMVLAIGLAGLVLMASACNPAPKRDAEPPGSWMPSSSDPKPAVKEAFGVGDAEAALHIEAVIAERSKGPNVKTDVAIDMRQRPTMATADIAPPAPKELWVTFTLKSLQPFAERPAAVRIKILRENDVIGSFDAVMGADATKKPAEYSLDVLAGLSAAPATMLVHAQAEVILLPAGTDIATTDPAKVTGTPTTTGTLLSNPVRINFAPAGGQG